MILHHVPQRGQIKELQGIYTPTIDEDSPFDVVCGRNVWDQFHLN